MTDAPLPDAFVEWEISKKTTADKILEMFDIKIASGFRLHGATAFRNDSRKGDPNYVQEQYTPAAQSRARIAELEAEVKLLKEIIEEAKNEMFFHNDQEAIKLLNEALKGPTHD